jgi:hypothetical protein
VGSDSQDLIFLQYAFGKKKKGQEKGRRQTGGVCSSVKDHSHAESLIVLGIHSLASLSE